MSFNLKCCVAIVLGLPLAQPLLAASAFVTYEVTSITVPGAISSSGRELREDGTVLIASTLPDPRRFNGYTYRADQGLAEAIPGESVSSSAFNDVGQFVGNRGGFGSYIYSAKDGFRTIPTLGGPGGANPFGINNSGMVIGASNFFGEPSQSAYIWNSVADEVTILDPTRTYYSSGYGINEAGWAVGAAWLEPTYPVTKHAFRYGPSSGFEILSGLGGTLAVGSGVNDFNVVVGTAMTTSDEQRAVVWTQDGTLVELGSLGDAESSGMAINNSGQIVGTSNNRAFLYQGGEMVDLNGLLAGDSGVFLRQAIDINENGEILAVTSGFGAVLLTPVPESSSLLSVSLGFVLALYRRRR